MIIFHQDFCSFVVFSFSRKKGPESSAKSPRNIGPTHTSEFPQVLRLIPLWPTVCSSCMTFHRKGREKGFWVEREDDYKNQPICLFGVTSFWNTAPMFFFEFLLGNWGTFEERVGFRAMSLFKGLKTNRASPLIWKNMFVEQLKTSPIGSSYSFFQIHPSYSLDFGGLECRPEQQDIFWSEMIPRKNSPTRKGSRGSKPSCEESLSTNPPTIGWQESCSSPCEVVISCYHDFTVCWSLDFLKRNFPFVSHNDWFQLTWGVLNEIIDEGGKPVRQQQNDG